MRLKLTEHVHTTSHRVLYADTDAAGIVYHANYLRYFEIGRTELMRNWVHSYKEVEALGILLPVTECYTRFKSPALYDDVINIETSVTELRKYSCRFHYRITRDEQDSDRPRLLVKGFTVNASVNREGKLVELPRQIMAKLENLVKIT